MFSLKIKVLIVFQEYYQNTLKYDNLFKIFSDKNIKAQLYETNCCHVCVCIFQQDQELRIFVGSIPFLF